MRRLTVVDKKIGERNRRKEKKGLFSCCRRQLAGKACFQFNLKAVVLNEYSRRLFRNRKGEEEMDKQEITGDHAEEREKQQLSIPEGD